MVKSKHVYGLRVAAHFNLSAYLILDANESARDKFESYQIETIFKPVKTGLASLAGMIQCSIIAQLKLNKIMKP